MDRKEKVSEIIYNVDAVVHDSASMVIRSRSPNFFPAYTIPQNAYTPRMGVGYGPRPVSFGRPGPLRKDFSPTSEEKVYTTLNNDGDDENQDADIQ